jgi:PAS domain S-box-containing protein
MLASSAIPVQDNRHPLYAMDARGRIVFCNEAFAELLGLKPEQILGKPSLLFFPSAAAPVLLRSRVEAMLHEGAPSIVTTTLRRPGGEGLPVELRVTSLDADGEFSGHLVLVHPVRL